ncbi:MAG: hypothetical protein AAGU74_10325 [Bacillota bacterium]
MTALVQKVTEMLEMLPEQDQDLAYQMVKKLLLAWDPDFTRLTPKEQERLNQALKETETISHDQINWN